MHNSRIITNEFAFFQPGTLTELLNLLEDTSVDTLLIAGGTDVIPKMKAGQKSPKRLISTMKVGELDFVTTDNGMMRIGASTKLKKIVEACEKIETLSVLKEAVATIGKLQILNMATIAGNICTASPAADSVPALLALDASVTLKRANGERDVLLKDFLLGPGKTGIDPQEVLFSINVPLPKENEAGGFKKLERVGSDIAKINIAIMVERHGDVCDSCKVAVGSCGPTTLLIDGPGKILSGRHIKSGDDELIRTAGKAVAEAITPIDDIRSTAEYRRKVASVIFMDTFKAVWEGSEGDA